LGSATPGQADLETKHVLVLHSFGLRSKPWADYARVIRTEIGRRGSVDFQEHSLLNARLIGDESDRPFVDYLHSLHADQPPDLIVAIGAPAAVFVQRHRKDLFPRTPMVLTAVERRWLDFDRLTDNDTVVAFQRDSIIFYENILHVLPLTTTIAVVIGASPPEAIWREATRKIAAPLAGRVQFRWYNELSFESILQDSSAHPPHSAIFWLGMHVDAAGVAHEGSVGLHRLSAVANAPIFSLDDSFFGEGVVGGPMQSVDELSKKAAEVALRILGGEKAGDIKPSFVRPASPLFDWRQMERWGISESRLPPGSEIHFREPAAWQRYRWQITSFLLALLVQSAMITWLLMERYGRRKAELESRRRSLEVMHLNRAAEAGALSASFAHEISQPLVSIMLVAEAAERLLSAKPDHRLKEMLGKIRQADQQAVEIIQHLKKLLKRRSEVETQEFDLNDVVADAMYVLFPEARDRNVALHANDAGQPLLVRADRVHLQQVIISLTMNGMDAMIDTALDARRITIEAALRAEAIVEVSVSDTGMGIPEGKLSEIFETFYTTKDQGTGLGLSVARTIVETYGGKIWAENRAGGGAVFRFTLPLVC
jgi:signal transduction histidine kinase